MRYLNKTEISSVASSVLALLVLLFLGSFTAVGQEANPADTTQSEISRIYQEYIAAGISQKKRQEILAGREALVISAAESGVPFAQFLSGKMHYEGWSVTKDPLEAVRWYRKAADQGNAFGQTSLGMMYAKGEGVAKDIAEALRWFRKAADQGNATGQANLALMYQMGEGVAKDSAEALRWFRKAADQGNATGQAALALMYQMGEGVAKDPAEAVRWYRKAADQGSAPAQSNLGNMYSEGEGVAKDPAEAVRWFRKAADQGDATGQFNLGNMYARGEGVPKDPVEAVRWYREVLSNPAVSRPDNIELREAVNNALKVPEIAQVTIQERSADILDQMAKLVKDPESGKDGGPTTKDVIRVINGGQENNVYGNASVIFGAIAQGMVQGKADVEAIRRGKVLTSFLSSKIPTGTEVFPIRVIFSSQIGSPQQDLYFYKDEFGDWAAIPKD
jgi:TPR repeat protein